MSDDHVNTEHPDSSGYLPVYFSRPRWMKHIRENPVFELNYRTFRKPVKLTTLTGLVIGVVIALIFQADYIIHMKGIYYLHGIFAGRVTVILGVVLVALTVYVSIRLGLTLPGYLAKRFYDLSYCTSLFTTTVTESELVDGFCMSRAAYAIESLIRFSPLILGYVLASVIVYSRGLLPPVLMDTEFYFINVGFLIVVLICLFINYMASVTLASLLAGFFGLTLNPLLARTVTPTVYLLFQLMHDFVIIMYINSSGLWFAVEAGWLIPIFLIPVMNLIAVLIIHAILIFTLRRKRRPGRVRKV